MSGWDEQKRGERNRQTDGQERQMESEGERLKKKESEKERERGETDTDRQMDKRASQVGREE